MTSARVVGYVRAFVTLLVVLHHAVLAYHPFAPPPGASLVADRWWLAFPVSDPAKSMTVSLLAFFNDVFFMALMFLLSGLFVWQSLQRKGPARFLRDRSVRLGVPFLISAALLAPVAYYPSYLATTDAPTMASFIDAWLSLGIWPAGPAWFLWVLLAFDAVAAALFGLAPSTASRLAQLASSARIHPVKFFLTIVSLSLAAYLPLVLAFDAVSWTTVGPFTVQTSRVMHYLLYFLLGIGVGVFGLEKGLLAVDGALARRWWAWVAAALVTAGATLAQVVVSLSPEPPPLPWDLLNGVAFVLSCGLSSMAVLAVFVRFARPSTVLDNLRDNAYGIYLVHYAIVTWVQYTLLPATWPGLAKAAVAFAVTVAIAWSVTALARRVPVVARVI